MCLDQAFPVGPLRREVRWSLHEGVHGAGDCRSLRDVLLPNLAAGAEHGGACEIERPSFSPREAELQLTVFEHVGLVRPALDDAAETPERSWTHDRIVVRG